jgi:hypothetical protein
MRRGRAGLGFYGLERLSDARTILLQTSMRGPSLNREQEADDHRDEAGFAHGLNVT